jgi:hypothetical protein
MRKLSSTAAEDVYEVKVKLRSEHDVYAGGRARQETSRPGKIKRSKMNLNDGGLQTASAVSNESAVLKRNRDGKSIDWFWLRLGEK